MIYSHTMMSGYLTLQGSYMFHIPMLIAMLIFIRVPSEEDLEVAFPEQSSSAAIWYWYAVGMHFVLALMQMLYGRLDEVGALCGAVFLAIQTAIVGLEMWNLCLMMNLYSSFSIHGKHVKDVEPFSYWLLIEIYMIISTVITASIYMFTRSISRGALEFYTPMQDES